MPTYRYDDKRNPDRPMRPVDDRYFDGPERQIDDWERRNYDANPFDRAEGMYKAGGRDFTERLHNVDGRDESRGFVENVKNFFGVGPKGYHRSDERIREDVCEALSRHPEVNAADIDVKVKDGHVFLLGTVDSRWMKRQAEDAVAYVSGVEEVRNELTIPRNTDQTGEVILPRATGTRDSEAARKFGS